MYSYEWDAETGGLLLNSSPQKFSKEPRPVYYQELDLLGFNKYWNYAKDDSAPYMWAETNTYIYRGRPVAKTKGGSVYTAPELIILDEPEPNHEELRFVNIPAMVEKNRSILESLVQDTIKDIYNIYVQYSNKVDVFYVAFSGGKDSIVTLDLVQRALPHNKFKVLFGDTGMEFPDTYNVIDKIENWCKDEQIVFLRAKSEFNPEDTWRKFGPPSQRMRWCCSVHKSAPQILLLRKITNNPQFRGMAFTGVRGDESVTRKEYKKVEFGKKVRGQGSCHPILDWNTAELYLYIYANNLIINEAYKKGNSRAGCLVCPLATEKNMFFKEQSYSDGKIHGKSTTTFNDIILETTSKELSSQDAVDEFMNIGGWKARRSGKELSIAKTHSIENFENNILTIRLLQQQTSWKEWLKTVGKVIYHEDGNIEIIYDGTPYFVNVTHEQNETIFMVNMETHNRKDILFMSSFKIALRKSAYCIGCKVCEANCPYGFISMKDGIVKIDDNCIKCRKCHDISHGCLVADSLKIPKGERKMGNIDRYGNMGIEYTWVLSYFKSKDEFWDSAHGLGTNKVRYLKAFLRDSNIVNKKCVFTDFGHVIDKIGIEKVSAWGLIACNVAYTSEFNWWIKNIVPEHAYIPDEILSMLDDSMTKNSRTHIVSAYRNIFISNPVLSNEIGMGVCDYEIKNEKRRLNTVTRKAWQNPDPNVILYSLYKFAEACGDYYQFTLSRLMDFDVESDGISPAEIFCLDRETMEKILSGLSINHPDFITTRFNLDLDTITLNSDKTAEDVLALF